MLPPRCRDNESQIQTWIHAVRWSLLLDVHWCGQGNLSRALQSELLREGPDDDHIYGMEDEDHQSSEPSESIYFCGVPRRPLYKELAVRLFRWNGHGMRCSMDYLFLPAKKLGFETCTDLHLRTCYPPKNSKYVGEWFRRYGDTGVLCLLGMRHTAGSDPRPLVPPGRPWLLAAADRLYKPPNKLTVAARARSKHAIRCSHGYFGIARGNPEVQNNATRAILVKLINEAVWINIHTFGGLEKGNSVMEIRVATGYGARWTADWSSIPVSNIEFRGFLEPQATDGHERRWKHV